MNLPLIQSLGVSNKAHIEAATDMVKKIGAKKVGVLGLAFKPGTDDLRESPVLEVIAALNEAGIEVVAHDTVITRATPIGANWAMCAMAAPACRLWQMICLKCCKTALMT